MRDLIIRTTCPLCGAESEVAINADDYAAWQRGQLIQNSFPYLTASQREALMTGICDPCWENSYA